MASISIRATLILRTRKFSTFNRKQYIVIYKKIITKWKNDRSLKKKKIFDIPS